MDQMSLTTILLVSVPEQLILLITVLLMIARFDLVKLNKPNILKAVGVIVINTAFVDAMRAYSTSFMFHTVVSTIFVAVMYILILKVTWHETVVATFLTVVYYYIVELVVISIIISIFKLDVETILKNDWVRIALTIPVRIVELIPIIVLRMIPIVVIDLKPLKITVGYVKRFSVLAACLLIALVMIANTISVTVFEGTSALGLNTAEYITLNVVFAIVLIGTVIYNFIKNKKSFEKQRIDYLNTISHIESLLDSGNNGIIKAREIIRVEKMRWGGRT